MGRSWRSSSPSCSWSCCWVPRESVVENKRSRGAAALNRGACAAGWGGVAFSASHAGLSDKGLVHSERLGELSPFHPPPPELAAKGFLHAQQGHGTSSSAIAPSPPACFQREEAPEEPEKRPPPRREQTSVSKPRSWVASRFVTRNGWFPRSAFPDRVPGSLWCAGCCC